MERFNRSYREEILKLQLFTALSQVRDLTRKWLKKYNEQRPHDALADLTSAEYLLLKIRSNERVSSV